VIQCAPKKKAEIINVNLSGLELILKLIFLNLQYINKKTAAKADLHQIITGIGISMYLPNAPDVLTKTVAIVNQST
jgi:hypothetical protein